MNQYVRTLRSHLSFWFLLVIGIILVLIWLFQVFFIVPYYERRMRASLVSTSRGIVLEYEKDSSNEKFEMLSTNAINDNIHIMCVLINDKNELITTKGQFSPVYDIKNFTSDFYREIVLESSQEKLFIFKQRDSNDLYVYATKLEGSSFTDNEYLLTATKVTPIAATTMIIQEQLIWISSISILIGLTFAVFASKKISKPLADLQAQATEFAKGNYDIVFEGTGCMEVVELADTLTETAKELKATDELRKSITANVSHDLRTPLTIIKSYAEMIRDLSGNNKEKREEHLDIIISETDRLSELVNDVLALSKLESGVVNLEKKDFNISVTLETCLTKYEIYQMKSGYIIECDIDEDIYVNADEKRINGVFYNLIGNAINYTGSDKKVFISLKKEGNKAIFKVKDTGEGISTDKQKRIWEQYYRDENNHQRAVVGTGLGLSIVKNVLDLHKLKYGVESIIGSGTTFYFEIDIIEECAMKLDN